MYGFTDTLGLGRVRLMDGVRLSLRVRVRWHYGCVLPSLLLIPLEMHQRHWKRTTSRGCRVVLLTRLSCGRGQAPD